MNPHKVIWKRASILIVLQVIAICAVAQRSWLVRARQSTHSNAGLFTYN